MIFALLSLYVGGALTERENPRQARLMRSIGEKNQTILKVPGNIPTNPRWVINSRVSAAEKSLSVANSQQALPESLTKSPADQLTANDKKRHAFKGGTLIRFRNSASELALGFPASPPAERRGARGMDAEPGTTGQGRPVVAPPRYRAGAKGQGGGPRPARKQGYAVDPSTKTKTYAISTPRCASPHSRWRTKSGVTDSHTRQRSDQLGPQGTENTTHWTLSMQVHS